MSDATILQRVEVLGHGFIEVVDFMGSDLAVANNAKVSFDRQVSRAEYDSDPEVRAHVKGLLNFLVRERHGSPLERPIGTFRVKAPIFVMREWHRHRMASLNEESMRYSLKDKPEMYVPADEAVRTQVGKPGAYRYERITDGAVVAEVQSKIALSQHFAFRTYRELIDMGVAKEVARVVIPVGCFSTMIWQANLRSIFNFLSLRNSEHAQYEIRVYAEAMEAMVKELWPITTQAFIDNGRVAP